MKNNPITIKEKPPKPPKVCRICRKTEGIGVVFFQTKMVCNSCRNKEDDLNHIQSPNFFKEQQAKNKKKISILKKKNDPCKNCLHSCTFCPIFAMKKSWMDFDSENIEQFLTTFNNNLKPFISKYCEDINARRTNSKA